MSKKLKSETNAPAAENGIRKAKQEAREDRVMKFITESGRWALAGVLFVGIPVATAIGIKQEVDEHAREELAKRTAIEQSFETGITLSSVELSDEKTAGEALIDDGTVKVVDKFIVEGASKLTVEPFLTGNPDMPVLGLPGSETEHNYFLTLEQKQINSNFTNGEGFVTYIQEVPFSVYAGTNINDILQFESLTK